MATKNISIFYKIGDEMRELVSLKDASKLVGKCVRSLQNDMQTNKLNPVYIQRLVYFDKSELLRGKNAVQNKG